MCVSGAEDGGAAHKNEESGMTFVHAPLHKSRMTLALKNGGHTAHTPNEGNTKIIVAIEENVTNTV